MSDSVNAVQEWKIVRKIGEGGFGKVYEIMRSRYSIEEHRALKVIRIPEDPNDVKQIMSEGMDEDSAKEYYRSLVNEFIKEIAFLSELRGSAHIVTYDDYKVVQRSDGFGWDIYIMMELLTPLPDILAKGKLDEKEVRKLGMDICDALSTCHGKNILHRDIKAGNIFVAEDGAYKLGDFGIARTVEKTSAAHTRIGTDTYIAPETYRGENYDNRADIYSLGILLYRLLNDNRIPFLPPYPTPVTVTERDEAMTKRLSGEPLPRPAHGSDELCRAILKACQYRPEDRFATAEDMKAALAATANPAAYNAHHEHIEQPPYRPAGQQPYRPAEAEEPVRQRDPEATMLAEDMYYRQPQPQRQDYARQAPDRRQPERMQQRNRSAYYEDGYSGGAAPYRAPAPQNSYRRPMPDNRRRSYDQRSEPKSSGINAGLAVVIILIVLVLIGGGVTIFALLNSKSSDKNDTSVSTVAASSATEAGITPIMPEKSFSLELDIRYNFVSPVPLQFYVDGEEIQIKNDADSDEQQSPYIQYAGSLPFTLYSRKTAEVIAKIDGSEYYRCTLDYDSGTIINGNYEDYYDTFYSDKIAY